MIRKSRVMVAFVVALASAAEDRSECRSLGPRAVELAAESSREGLWARRNRLLDRC